MIRKQFYYGFWGIVILCNFQILFAQEPVKNKEDETPGDTLHLVEILGARKLELRKVDDSTNLQILSGNVKLRQGKTLFDCDSCVINNRTNTFEAFGHVHINDADTANVFADYLQYLMQKKVAYLKNNVRLTDGKGTLTTSELEYDVDTKLGIYKSGGKVVNKKTTLTSREAYYYTDLKDVYFKKNVELKDPAYQVRTDSLIYNTENETMRFIAKTIIKDSSGRTIETSEGYYDLKSGKAEFGKNPVIKDGATTIRAERITNDDSTGISRAEGKVVITDTAEGRTIMAELVVRNKKNNSLLATGRPLMILKQDNDSVYIIADSLLSARLSDLQALSKDSLQIDTLKGLKVVSTNENDSTNRYFKAWYNVRIFSDSLQGVCDSLFYSFEDSVFRMFTRPVLWSKQNQITGDTILLFTKNKKADRIRVFENSFLVNKSNPEIFNQIKATRMEGYFVDGSIDSIRAKGFAECIYFIQDEDSAYTGINESKADMLDIYFKEKELQKVVFRSDVTGTIWPMKQKEPQSMRLQNFIWLESKRPKSKFELLERK
jgi:lipopolysaccharide export system protein LptA